VCHPPIPEDEPAWQNIFARDLFASLPDHRANADPRWHDSGDGLLALPTRLPTIVPSGTHQGGRPTSLCPLFFG
jgi:hypothetical protein